MTKLYAIRDTLAGAIVGPVQTFKHDAVAVRFFGDVAAQPGTSINAHVEQHELLFLAQLDDESGEIMDVPEQPVVVMTGSAWKALQETTK